MSNPACQLLESGERMPGIETVERLANVLGVSAAWLAYGAPPMRRILNCRTAPGFEITSLAEEVQSRLLGCGGRVDQSWLYLDPWGAAQYARIALGYKSLPIQKAATKILMECRDALTVIALGSGTCRHEARLAQVLTQAQSAAFDEGEARVELFLVDSSPTLLGKGYRHSVETLEKYNLPIVAVEGDFTKLASYMDYFNSGGGPRRRVITMLGYTIGNFANEVAMVRDSLVGAARDDFFLVDYVVNGAPDPILNKTFDPESSSLHFGFLLSPLRRVYGVDADISVVAVGPDEPCVIPGSTAVELHATVQTRSGPKTFVAGGWKRYDPKEFANAMHTVGWEQVAAWEFDDDRPSMLALFRRQ